MSGKVTNDQIRQTTINVDSFRQAVNYVNPKNKGYVRFEPDGKGGVKIAKINNKIDIFVNMRTNIDAQKNKAMREKFVTAITHSLKWADQAKVEDIKRSITHFTQGANEGRERTDALSRKELQTAFKSYDQLVNSYQGRQEMIDNLLKDAAKRCGMGEDKDAVERLKNRFFSGKADKELFLQMLASDTQIPVGQPDHMKMGELEFLTHVHTLELRCDDAVKRSQVENLMRNQAETYVGAGALGNDFGMHLSINDKAQLRGALLHFLSEKGYVPQQGNGGVIGTGGMIFEEFIDKVLPELFKKSVSNVIEAGGNADRELQMDANFSFDAIMEEAEKFMIGAKNYIENPPQDEIVLTGDQKIDGIIQMGKSAVDKAKEKTKVGYMQTGAENILKTTNIPKEDAKEVLDGMKNGVKAFDAAGLLRTFTQKFLAERGIGEELKPTEEKDAIFKNTLDSIFDTAIKVGIGAKLQYGSAKMEDGKKVAVDSGMGGYVKDMEDAIGEIASGKNGLDQVLMGKLFTCTLANIANRKVELVANGVGANMKLDKASEAEDRKQLEATAKAYVSFEKNVMKTISGAKAAFEKVAKAAKKKGLVTEDMFNKLLENASAKFAQAHKAALNEFFLKSPVKDAADGAQMLQRLFKAKLSEANAELNNDLNVMSLGSAIGTEHRNTLLDINGRIKDAMAQTGLDKVKVGRPGIIGEEMARKRLEGGPLKRLYTETLTKHLNDIKPDGHGVRRLTQKNVEDIVKNFNDKAAKLLKSVAESETKFIAECEKVLGEQIANNVENESGEFKGYVKRPKDDPIAPMTSSEKKELVKNLTDEVLRYKTSALRDKFDEILDAPESFAKKDVKALARQTIDDFDTGGAERTVSGIMQVVKDRKKMVNDFLNSDDMNMAGSNIDDKGVFGEGGILEKAGPTEKGFFIVKGVKAVKARMEAMPLVYATGDKVALSQRISIEALKAAEKPAKEWADFRKKFMAEIAPLEANYSSFGDKKIATFRDLAISEILSDSNGKTPDLKMAVEYYRNVLQRHLDNAITKITTSFNDYVAKVDRAFEPTKARFKAIIDANMPLYKNALTAEAYEYLEKTIIPNYVKDLETQIYRNPDDFAPDKLNAFEKKVKDGFSNVMLSLFDALSTKTDDGLKNLVKIVGAGVLLDSEVQTQAALGDLKTWLASTEGHDKLVACEKALLDHLAEFGGSSFDIAKPEKFMPAAKGNAVETFRAAANDILKMHTVHMLYVAFDNNRVGEAKEVFDRWVDSHGLSKFPDFNNTTAKERITAEFDKRVKSLQENGLKGEENEPILTSAFIELIDHIIDSTGAEALIGEWKTKMTSELEGRYLKKGDETSYVFDSNDPKTKKLGTVAIQAAENNLAHVRSVLGSCVSGIAGELLGVGGIDDTRKAISAINMEEALKKVNDEMIVFTEKCVNSFQLEEEMNKHRGNYEYTIERALVKAAVGEELAKHFPNGLNDLLSTNVGQDDKVKAAVGEVKKAIAITIASAQKHCRDKELNINYIKSTFDSYALDCIKNVKNSNIWLNGTIFNRGGLSVALNNAAKELQSQEKAKEIK